MAGPVVPPPADLGLPEFKLTLFFSIGGNGWTETMYFQPNTSDPTQLVPIARNALRQWATIRAAGLPKAISIVDGRFANVAVPNAAALEDGNLFPLSGQPTPGVSYNGPWLTVDIRMYDPTLQIRRIYTVRGIPETYTINLPSGGIAVNTANATLNTMKGDLFNLFAHGTPPGSTVSIGNFTIRYVDKSVNGNTLWQVYNLSVSSDGFIQYHVLTATGITLGSVVRIRKVRQACVKGLSGQTKVIATPTSDPDKAGGVILKTAKRLCCPALGPVTPQGNWSLQGLRYSYAPIGFMDYGRAAIRKTGRAFFVTVGKSGKACCSR